MKKVTLIIISLILSYNALVGQEEESKKELKPALLVIDIQNQYVPMMDQQDKDLAFEYINAAIWVFRKYDLSIIRIYHTDKEWGPETDSEEFKFAQEIGIEESDAMVTKNYGNAFTKTDLDKILKEKEVNTVFLCGLSATGCVLATYIGANDHDYKVFMIQNALLSPNGEHTDFIEIIMNTVSLETLMFMLEYTQ
ncbi:MAG: cysteine hydrolase [Bacteroidales bacterium]|nr:cysteine hydrolase [Bacteroidales bacterium]